MKICSDILHRMTYNCRLYQIGKNSASATMKIETSSFGMSINDGHLYLQDVESFGELWTTQSWTCTLGADSLKDLELELRNKEGDLEVDRDGEGNLLVDGIPYTVSDFYGDLDAVGVLDGMSWGALRDRPFAVMADRFRKFSLIKTPGEYPMDFKLVWHNKLERELLAFQAGPTVRGALAMLDRKFLREDVAAKDYLWHTSS